MDLKRFDADGAQMARLCSSLCQSKQESREHHSYGLWVGADVRFELPEKARSWWTDIQTVANQPELASLLPAYAFARTIIAHPFPDGNGRLARALVHASLARTANLRAPFLALAPAFYLNAAKVAAAIRQLSASGDWNAFNVVFQHVLADALHLSRQALAWSAGDSPAK